MMNTSTHSVTNNSVKCIFCKDKEHTIFKCSKFISLDISSKRAFISKNRLCFNCFHKGHAASQCYREKCKVCSSKHHYLLHENRSNLNGNNLENSENNQTSLIAQGENNEITQTSTCTLSQSATENLNLVQSQTLASCAKGQVLLATARFILISEEGNRLEVRGLLDSASQTTFVTTEVVNKLNGKPFKTNLNISGIAQSNNKVSKMIDLKVESKVSSKERYKVTCGILEKITCNLPQQEIDTSQFVIPPGIVLSDIEYFIPDKIDMLIGADLYFELLEPGIIRLGSNLPILQNSKLGWVLGGSVKFEQESAMSNLSVALFSRVDPDINNLIPKFWQLEEISNKRIFSPEDKMAEKIFSESTKRDINGKFVVNLPLKKDIQNLPLNESFQQAKRRFLSLENRLHKDKRLFDQYKAFIDEYVYLQHASYIELSMETKDSLRKYFLPHHCVIREEAVSTKLRVVFDASMKTSSGVSLNELMYKGPTVQPDLFDIVCRFRTLKFVFTTDIVKMYRQILINPDHRHLQNILWRDTPNQDIKCVQLNTVTYGTNCAPFLATRCLIQLANESSSSHPLASQCLIKQTYVDDVLGGSNNFSEFCELQKQLIDLLGSAGFSLHKWVFNLEPKFSRDVKCKDNQICNIHVDESLNKVLGISWKALSDEFCICGFPHEEYVVPTKRNVLSHIAKLFDPLGFIGPIVILGKILMQKIWAAKLDWDSSLTEELVKEWNNFANNISNLKDLQVPRLLYDPINEIKSFEIHGFSDASMKAYGACVYLRTIYCNNQVSCKLMCSKSRVAPLKVVTLPRLELCGFLLLARLCHKLISIVDINLSRVVLWTDSKIVLCWLNSTPDRWTTFVSNRVSEIQELTSNFQLHHVSSADNPADHISRGLDPVALSHCEPWWNGPRFLNDSSLQFVKNELEINDLVLPELKLVTHASVETFSEAMEIFSKFSRFRNLQRTIAYCLRFVNNSSKNKEKLKGTLSVDELLSSQSIIVRCIQGHYFAKEMQNIKSNIPISSGHLSQLAPFIDEDNILRVKGRLSHGNLPFSQRFPIILPPKDHVVKLLYIQEHVDLQHAGPQTVLAHLRLRFWPINGLRAIKKEIKTCLVCYRFRAVNVKQIMAPLPAERISIARPFLKVGIDFGGPILIKESKLRKARTFKSYIALFVCMVTKAIHLELVTSLSSDAFLSTLKRFIARRGHPQMIFSDNGTNFQGANNILKDVYNFFKENKNKVEEFLSLKEIRWKFIPPNSPHWGGLWEAGIKSTKFHLRRVIGNHLLTYEQLSTLLCQIEAILNSRPLSALSSDPSDYLCLAPSHFLVGEMLTSFPEKDYSNEPENRLDFWKHCEKMRQVFWNRWSIEYLNRLQHRPKWTNVCNNIKENDLVLVREDNSVPLDWRLARVIEIFPGKDGNVRVAKIRTQCGIFTRPISKLSLLPFCND